jgi:hypothetical protein
MQAAATVTMSASELERLRWMRALVERRATQREVAGHLGLGVRQVQRLRDAFRRGGARRLRVLAARQAQQPAPGAELPRPGARRRPHNYAGFGPTLAHEKLVEQHGLSPS